MSEEQRSYAKGSEATLNRFMSHEEKQDTPPVFFLILGAFLIFLFGSALFSMEKHFAEQKSALSYINQQAIALPSVSSVDGAFNGKLVHAQGSASTSDTIVDERFGIAIKALGLIYKVEYYQDIDTGDSSDVDWSNRPARYLNPQDYELNSRIAPDLNNEVVYAQNAKLGVYDLGPKLLQGLRSTEPLDLKINPEQLEILHTAILEAGKKALHTPDSVAMYLKALQQGENPRSLVKIVDNSLYFGFNPSDPQLGDTRLTFYIIPEQDVSIVATVDNTTFRAYREPNGSIIPLIYAGKVDTQEVIDLRFAEDKSNAWSLRLLFLLLIIFGARMIVSYYRKDAAEKNEETILTNMNPWGPSILLGFVLAVLISFSGQLFA